MVYVVRIKAVSLCLGIRRANVIYIKLSNDEYDLSSLEHPLKLFKNIKLNNNEIEILGKKKLLKVGEEVFFYNNKKVVVNNGDSIEEVTLGAMILPLDIEMKDYYIDAINNGFLFDQWNGEFEYLLGMMYELDQNDFNHSNEYYNIALKKGFKFKLLKNEHVS